MVDGDRLGLVARPPDNRRDGAGRTDGTERPSHSGTRGQADHGNHRSRPGRAGGRVSRRDAWPDGSARAVVARVETPWRTDDDPPTFPFRYPGVNRDGRGVRFGPRAAVAAVVTAVVLGASGYAVYTLSRTQPLTGLSAQVVSTGQVALSFPDDGVLATVSAHPGQRVRAHQLLATETIPGAAQQLVASQAAVTADQQEIKQLKGLLRALQQQVASASASQQQMDAAEVQAAAVAISGTSSQRQTAISALQQAVSSATQMLQGDQSAYRSQCPGGVTSQPCATMAHNVQADHLAVAAAEASLSEQRAAQSEWTALANRALSDAQATQQGSAAGSATAVAPLEVDLANAQSQLQRDQGRLSTAGARSAAEQLFAPQAGTVISVNGTPGEVVTGAGVAGAPDSGGSVAVSPGFQLFPSQQSTAGPRVPSAPVVVLSTPGALLATVVVPESQIGLVHVGAPVTITAAVAGLAPIHGVVQQIFPSSIVAAGVVSYEVQVRIDPSAVTHGYLAGMTASASIGR